MMNEFKELIEKAQKQLGCPVNLTIKQEGWSLYKPGLASDDIYNGTFEACITKLKEWATPPKPEFVMLKVPYDQAVFYAQHGSNNIFAPLCIEAIKPYEV